MKQHLLRRRTLMQLALGTIGVVLPAVACNVVRPDGGNRAPQQLAEAPTPSSPAERVAAALDTLASAIVPTPTSGSARPNYFSTAGAGIVDGAGNKVLITGVNWFGMETGTSAPHGLWARNWQEMLDQIAALGYNTIRLPYSNAILDPKSRPAEGIDFNKNADLRGLTGLEIMDKIVQGAGERDLKIILDRHRPTPESQSKLWYTDKVPEERWIADWQTLARRYLGNDTVIGADLHNEPAGEATWGSGDQKTDWRLAAERAGNAIHAVNPHWLIVVEGIERYDNDWYWWGGNLQGAATAPVRLSRPNKLVYSAHDYGPGVYNQPWFNAPDFPRNLSPIWDKHWGYLVRQNVAPVLLGEFGGRSVSPNDKEGIWQRLLLGYLKESRIHYTYWCFNPNSGDTGGILKDDWRTVDDAKQALLTGYQAPRTPIYYATVVNLPFSPSGPHEPTAR